MQSIEINLQDNEESIVFMAFDDNEAIGFVHLYPSFSSVSMKQTWVLNDFYVKEYWTCMTVDVTGG